MNILHINTLDRKGGAAKVAYMLAKKHRSQGHTAHMCVGKKQYDDPWVFNITQPNTFVRALNKLTGKNIERRAWDRISNIFYTDLSFFNNRGLFKSNAYKQADIVHLHNIHGTYFNIDNLERISREKNVVWTLHDMWSITPGCAWSPATQPERGFYQCNPRKRNRSYLIRKKKDAYSNAEFHLVTPSQWLRDKVKQTILDDVHCTHIPNGIDTDTFKPYMKKQAREELGLPQDKKIIAFIAVHFTKNKQKGWEYAQEVIERYSNDNNIHFLCIGGEMDSLPENSTAPGYIHDERILSRYYAAADVFLMTSIYENFPLTVLEAMASGLPVVSFDVGGVKEAVIHRETGYIAERENAKDLIDGIKYVLSQKEEQIKRMSEKSRKQVIDHFTLSDMTNQYMELYKKCLDKSNE